MPIEEFKLDFQRGGEQWQLKFLLDRAMFTQGLMHECFLAQRLYESETSAILAMLLQPGDSFIDVGAHVGYFSLLASAYVGPKGRVFAFEPDGANFGHLLRHLHLNGVRNVVPHNWAVGNTTGPVELYINADNDGGHALWDPGRHPLGQRSRTNVQRVAVFQASLDDLFANATPGFVKLMKIDVEGNEVHVLRGAKEMLRRALIPAVIAEVNHFALAQLGATESEMRGLMSELGYTTYVLAGPAPVRLAPEQTLKTELVFNLLFASPQLQATVCHKWPQAVPS